MAVKFMKFPEIENAKERSVLEFAWLERQQAEELKKNQQNYINFGGLPDEIVRPAVLWVYYQGLSILPKDGHIYFEQITAENEDGEIVTVALQPKIQYQGEIHLAVHGENARYDAVEMLVDGKVLGAESIDRTPFSLDSILTIRVIDKKGEAKALTKTIAECLQHGLDNSPTIAKFKGNLENFWKGYEKYIKGDQSLFNPWFANPLAMCAKTVWRKIDGQDKITTYSKEYLEKERERAIDTQELPKIAVNIETGEVLTEHNPLPMIEENTTADEDIVI